MFKKLIASQFIKNFSVLASSTFISQLAALLLMPVLTRMYDPDAFGVLSSFQAAVGLICSMGALGYHVAIIIEPDENSAKQILKFCSFVSIIISVLVIAILCIPIGFFKIYKDLKVLIGITILLQLMNIVYTQWNIRRQQFKRNAVYYILQSVSMFLFQFILAYFFTLYGLVLGLMLGYTMSNLYMHISTGKERKDAVPIAGLLPLLKRYINFPKYYAPACFIEALSASLPVFF